MPNHLECCSKPILDYVIKEIPDAVVNLLFESDFLSPQINVCYEILKYGYLL